MSDTIYADHAATTPLEPEAWEAMCYWLTKDFSNPAALYRSGIAAHQAVERARQSVAECLRCSASQIFFTSGGSESNTWAILSGASRAGIGSREVVTTPIEHHSVGRACASLKNSGIAVYTLPVSEEGKIDLPALLRALERQPRLVTIQYANNEVGTIQDIPTISTLCQKKGVLLHVDAVQAVGHIPVVLDGIDFLSASAHKFGGPKGIGFLYARNPALLKPLIFGGEQQSGLRPGTEPVAQIVGLACALKLTCKQMEQHAAFKRMLAEEFCQTLRQSWAEVYFNSTKAGLPGLVSVGLPGYEGQNLTYRLDVAGVCVSPGAACDNTRSRNASHVLLALGGTAARNALCTLRFSFGRANQPGDGTQAAQRLVQILQSMPKRSL